MPTQLAAKLSGLTLGKRKLPFKVLLLVVIALVLSLALAAALSLNLSVCGRALTGSGIPMRYCGSFRWRRDVCWRPKSAERGYLLTGERRYLEGFNRA